MNSRFVAAEARVRLVSRAILAVGFASAVVIYFVNTAPPASGYELEDSKKYLREMEVYGGKANVLAAGFRHWLNGLWHGRSLAFTVAVISVFLALAYRFVATPLPTDVDGDAGPKRSGP